MPTKRADAIRQIMKRWIELQGRIQIRLNTKTPAGATKFIVSESGPYSKVDSYRLWCKLKSEWNDIIDEQDIQLLPDFCGGKDATSHGNLLFHERGEKSGAAIHGECGSFTIESWVSECFNPVNDHLREAKKRFYELIGNGPGRKRKLKVQLRRQFIIEQLKGGKSINEITHLVNEPSRPWHKPGKRISVEVIRQDISLFNRGKWSENVM